MRARWRFISLLLLVVLLTGLTARAADPRTFVERRAGNAELKYINDVPVLVLAGTPEEMGRQQAILAVEAATKLADYPRQLLERAGHSDRLDALREMSARLAQQIPADHRAELRAYAEQSGIDRDMGVLGNTLVDVHGEFACSSLIVEPERSATKGPLFGRNLDFPTLGLLTKYGLVTVRRPKGKHAFATIGFPGVFGCVSGMNDAGLAVATHEIFLARGGPVQLNLKGTPYLFLFRQILEECGTIAEAEKLVRAHERTTMMSLALCDRSGGAVLEMTPKTVALRRGSKSVCACTNHFRTDDLAVFLWDPRYQKLIQSRKMDLLDVAAVAKKLNEVNLHRLTVQTMVFEPATLKLHLAMGECPSSALPLKLLELKPLLAP
jgi:isopenicillin-N N-acyltransferase like protein